MPRIPNTTEGIKSRIAQLRERVDHELGCRAVEAAIKKYKLTRADVLEIARAMKKRRRRAPRVSPTPAVANGHDQEQPPALP